MFEQDENNVWTFQPENFDADDLAAVDDGELNKIISYLNTITRAVDIFYRENAPRTPTGGSRVRLPAFLVAKAGFKQETVINGRLATAMQRVGVAMARIVRRLYRRMDS